MENRISNHTLPPCVQQGTESVVSFGNTETADPNRCTNTPPNSQSVLWAESGELSPNKVGSGVGSDCTAVAQPATARRGGKRPRPLIFPGDGTALVPLSKGLFSIIDEEDAPKVAGWCWTALTLKLTNYATRIDREVGAVYIHRVIFGLVRGDGVEVDHIDRNGLNNRKSNLRVCTSSQNRSWALYDFTSESGYIGVRKYRRQHGFTYQAVVKHHGKQHLLGFFDDPIEAARARDAKALELFGPFARLNFPLPSPAVIGGAA